MLVFCGAACVLLARARLIRGLGAREKVWCPFEALSPDIACEVPAETDDSPCHGPLDAPPNRGGADAAHASVTEQ
jgi:hypothetical protein